MTDSSAATPPLVVGSSQRSVEQLVGETITLWRRHWTALTMLGALAAPPAVAIVLVAHPLVAWRIPSYGEIGTLAGVLGVGGVWYAIVDAAIMLATRDARRDGRIDRGRVLRTASANWLPLVATSAVKIGGIVISTAAIASALTIAGVLLVGPMAAAPIVIVSLVAALAVAVYASCRLFAIPATVLFEPLSAPRAIARALAISRRRAWRIGLSFAPIGIAYWIMCGIAEIILTLITPTARIALAADAVVQVMLLPLISVFSTLLYFDLRD